VYRFEVRDTNRPHESSIYEVLHGTPGAMSLFFVFRVFVCKARTSRKVNKNQVYVFKIEILKRLLNALSRLLISLSIWRDLSCDKKITPLNAKILVSSFDLLTNEFFITVANSTI
jgi:hypothetical protein